MVPVGGNRIGMNATVTGRCQPGVTVRKNVGIFLVSDHGQRNGRRALTTVPARKHIER